MAKAGRYAAKGWPLRRAASRIIGHENLNNIQGERFGRWTVMRRAASAEAHAHWACRCDCGTESVVRGANLRDGTSESCGCGADEYSSMPFAEKREYQLRKAGVAVEPLFECRLCRVKVLGRDREGHLRRNHSRAAHVLVVFRVVRNAK